MHIHIHIQGTLLSIAGLKNGLRHGCGAEQDLLCLFCLYYCMSLLLRHTVVSVLLYFFTTKHGCGA